MTDRLIEDPPAPGEQSGLALALSRVQAELPHIAKSQTARVQTEKTSYSYSYADLAQVSKAILPLLGKHGLAWITKPTLTPDGAFVLSYRLVHVSGESDEGLYPLPKASTPQAMGSAITYARRYTLCSVTGVAPDSDDDDAAAVQADARPAGGRTVRRREQKPSDDGPALQPKARPTRAPAHETNLPPLPGEAPRGQPVSEAQMKMLHASFNQVGIAERDDRLAFASKTIGRDVKSSTELTKSEASRVIDSLMSLVDPEPPLPGEDGGDPS